MLRVVVALLILVVLPSVAQARHVYVAVETTLLYESGRFIGLRHKWMFGKFFTQLTIDSLPKNKDGRVDPEELAKIANINMESLKEFSYFTFPLLAGQPVKVGEATDYWSEYKDGELSLHFTLPFETPIPTAAKGLTFSVYDRSHYITFDFAATEQSVRLTEGAPKSCALKVSPPPNAIPIPGQKEVLVECDGS